MAAENCKPATESTPHEVEETLSDHSIGDEARPIIVGYAFGPKKMSTMGVVMAEASRTKISSLMPSPQRRVSPEEPRDDPSKDQVVFTIDGYGQSGQGLENIVRYFRSNCSDSESTGTCTASTNSSLRPSRSTSGSSVSRRQPWTPSSREIRVSFVPLDPDQPLEDQHGGRMDVILHKLTEDILCLSQLAREYPSLRSYLDHQKAPLPDDLTEDQRAALYRVHGLVDFQRQHPECCLVDNPMCVQTLMSREEIASTLERCLASLTTTSGLPVVAPKYAVLQNNDHLADQVAGLQFPLIVKPLIAAGTKASHSMAVVMDPAGLDHVPVPSLCQEYANHDALLYKVYVLGSHVSVHHRRSLPNLPRDQCSRLTHVRFDSQRPYPRLADFGYGESKKRPREALVVKAPPPKVTVEEIRPVVEALTRAFGLELYGFDFVVANRRLVVVDVNYFPSYKEVSNFPSLLAKYLTDRALASRKQVAAHAKSK